MILFHKEPLLFNSGRLATEIRRCSAAKLVLKLQPKCGYFTPMAASLEQGCISPPGFSLAPIWHQLCRGRVRQEHDTKARPLAHSWMLRLSAPTGPWVQGKEELIRFPSFEVGMQPQWRRSWSKAASNKVTLQGEPGHLQPAGERVPASEWALLFLLLFSASSTWSNWNQQFIGQIGLTQCFSKLICLRITGRLFWKPQISWFLP